VDSDEVFPAGRLVTEVARLVGSGRLGTLSKRESEMLRAAANAPDNGIALARLVETGPLETAFPAAMALAWVESPFVRRRVASSWPAATGVRRMLLAGALSPALAPAEWLPPLLLLPNDPELFVSMLAEGRDALDASTLARVEAWRGVVGASTAPLARALLGRRLTDAAREALLLQLGRTPGHAVAAVLEQEERRATGAAARLARRERMRQRLLPVPPAAHRSAVLEAHDDAFLLRARLDAPLPDGLVARTRLQVTREGKVESWETTADAAQATPSGDRPLPTGRLHRLFLAVVAPSSRSEVERRFEGLPVDDTCADPSGSTPVDHTGEEHNPLMDLVSWPASLLADGARVVTPAWPPNDERVEEVWNDRRAALLRTPGTRSLVAARLRVLSERPESAGDARPERVTAALASLASGRGGGPLVDDFARDALRLRLRRESALPDGWRAQLRDRLRGLQETMAPTWHDVRRLDLAQQWLETAARRVAATRGELPSPEELDAAVAFEVAERRSVSLSYWAAKSRGRAALPAWGEHCLRRCPHACFARPAADGAAGAWNGAFPDGPPE
jgi:hypothetical protein